MRRFFINVLIIFGSVLFFFALLEIGLAIFSPHKLKIRPYHEKYHPIMGWINQPLKDVGVQFEFAHDRFFHVKHNSLGLRGKETTYEKPSGTKRILFVGDSMFWGYGVSNNDILTEVLQKNLPSSFEVLNGGTTGYGTDQLFLWLKNEGLKFRPDIVVFGFTGANDLDELATSIVYYYPKPIFMLEGDKLMLKNVPVPRSVQTERKSFGKPLTLFGKFKKFLRYNTHTYQFIMGRLNSRPEWRLFFINIGLAEEYTTELGNIPLFKNPSENVWTIALKLLIESRKIAEESGSKFLLVYIPEKEKDPAGSVPYEGPEDAVYNSNTRTSAILSEFARKEKLPYLDLLPIVREHHKKGEILYTPEKIDHHWTALGHRTAAYAVHEYLNKAGWLQQEKH